MDYHFDPPDLLLLRWEQLGRQQLLLLRRQQLRLRLWLWLQQQLRLQRRLLLSRKREGRRIGELGAERKQKLKAHNVGLGFAGAAVKATQPCA